jgi:hypothetical protein
VTSLNINEEVDFAPVVLEELGGLTLDTLHVDLVIGQDRKCLVQHSMGFAEGELETNHVF